VHTSQAQQGSGLQLLSLIITAQTKKAALNRDKTDRVVKPNLFGKVLGGGGGGLEERKPRGERHLVEE
jgi:hypothetical protein